MKRAVIVAVLFLAPAIAGAQMQMGMNFGMRHRPDAGDGGSVWGTQFEGMMIFPDGRVSHQMLGAVVQMRNRNAAGANVRENSLEVGYLFRYALGGLLGLAAGPAMGYSTGCASGGTHGVTYGSTPCIASFASKGTMRVGYNVQLDFATSNARGVTLRFGARVTGSTVASGDALPKPVLWGGFSAPLNSR